MKKAISLLLTLLVVASLGTTALAADFADVDRGAWYANAVNYVVSNKLMGGYNDATFGPNDTLSRAMVVQVLYNKEGQPTPSGKHEFVDVSADQWFNNAVTWGTQKGVMGGYGNGKFGPNDNVTLEQLAVILWNYSGNPAFIGKADSVGAHSSWAANGLAWAVENDIFVNVPYSAVTDGATRAQTAQILMNYLTLDVVGGITETELKRNEAPYCPGNFSKIGETFSRFHVAGSGLQYGSGSLYILLVQKYPLIRKGWDAYTDYNGYGSRVGVANDTIVFNIQDLASSVTVAESLPADMLNITPLISCGTDEYGNVSELMLVWKGDNGYMVGFTTADSYPNSSYKNERVKFFISTVDLAYISNMPPEIIVANPAFN